MISSQIPLNILKIKKKRIKLNYFKRLNIKL